MLIALASQNWMLGLLAAIVIVAFAIIIQKNDLTQEKILMKYLDDLSAGVEAGTIYAVKNLPLGIALMDEKRNFVWANGVFRTWLNADIEDGIQFKDIFAGIRISKIWGKTGWYDFNSGDNYFRVYHKFINSGEDGNTPFMAFYIVDRTDMELAKRASEASMPVFGLIRIDNMAEATQNMTDVEKSNLLSEVNECILAEFSKHEAFIKQYEVSDYVTCLSRSALSQLMLDNFEILDKVRAIHTVNRIPVTLSIGIVESDEPFAKQFEEAHNALDLALGRGGDQAIVRVGHEVKAFGGKAPASVSSTRVRVRVVAQALREIIEGADQVLVMGHSHEDYDALGSAVGIAHLARVSGVPVNIVISTHEDTSRKMLECLRANKETKKLLIHEKEALNLITDRTVVFLTDTHIPQMAAAPEVLASAEKRVVIDHHRRSTSMVQHPLLTYMEPSASSASELVTELIQYYGGDAELSSIEASCLYAGLVVDTKNFSVQTSVRTFDAASYLRRSGADTKLVRELFAVNVETVKLKSEVMANMKMVDGFMVFAECPDGVENSQIIAGQVADYLITVEGIRASFIFYHVDDEIHISARSNGSVNVQTVMEALGGGGHMTVSGTCLDKNTSVDAATRKIIEEVRKQLKEE